MKNRSMSWLFAELTVVILGILIAFQIEGWRIERENNAAERLALTSILRELKGDLANLSISKIAHERQYEATVRLASNIATIEVVPEADLGQSYLDVLTRRSWSQSSPTYIGLRDSGGLSTISDSQLLSELTSYFEERVPSRISQIQRIALLRDALRDSAINDVFLSNLPALNKIEKFVSVEIADPSGNLVYAMFNKPIRDFPRDMSFYSILTEMNTRLEAEVMLLSELEDIILRLTKRIEAHLSEL